MIVGVVVSSAAVAVGRSGGSDSGSPSATPSTDAVNVDAGVRDAKAIAVLSAQERALARGSQKAYVQTWDQRSAAQRRSATIVGNLSALRVKALHARYVAADNVGLSSDEQRRLGGSAWTADVDVAWRLQGVDLADARTTLTYTFVARGQKVFVADVTGATGEHEPIWLLGPLDVRRSDRTVVAATNRASAEQLDERLQQAVADVHRVLPDWHGHLVSYGPSTQDEFDRLVAAVPRAYSGIAAVTTTVDGSRDPAAPIAIVANPTVFDGLGPIGSHVVISHEATHVATGATTVAMPLWVAEGFADYVGVGSVDVPLRVSARAAIRDIRNFGLPDELPNDAAFRARSAVEAAYEEAWLAIRVIARDYGQGRLVAFYEDVVRRPNAVARSLRDNLGITEQALTRTWQTYLRTVADGR